MNKVAILGSNSFSGSHCVNYFLEKTNCQVIGVSRSPEYSSIFLPYLYRKEKRPDRFCFYQWDINKDLKQILNLFDEEKPDVIINFAAQGDVQRSWTNPEQWLKTNCLGVSGLAFGLKNKKYLRKFIQISTPEVYGSCQDFKENPNYYNPSTPYAVSKAAGDLFLVAMLKNFNFPVCFVRSSNVYGIHQQLYRIIPRTIIYFKKGMILPLHEGGRPVRSFVHIRDIAEGIFRVAVSGKIGEIYHFSSEKSESIKKLVELICLKMDLDFENSVKISNERIGQDSVYSLDSSKAKMELGWTPHIALEDGIEEVIDWVNGCQEEIFKSPLEYIHKE